MKAVVAMFLLLLVSVPAFADGPCLHRANKLEAFANCMVPMQNGSGAVYKQTLAQLEGNSHAPLVNSMHAAMPVAYPRSYGYYGSPAAVMAPMISVAASKAYSSTPRSTFWTWYTMNSLYGVPY